MEDPLSFACVSYFFVQVQRFILYMYVDLKIFVRY